MLFISYKDRMEEPSKRCSSAVLRSNALLFLTSLSFPFLHTALSLSSATLPRWDPCSTPAPAARRRLHLRGRSSSLALTKRRLPTPTSTSTPARATRRNVLSAARCQTSSHIDAGDETQPDELMPFVM